MRTIDYATETSSDGPPVGTEQLLARAFAEPPYDYDEERIARRMSLWSEYAAVPGFRVDTARESGDLVGVAWSWKSVIGTADEPTVFGDLYRLIDAEPWSSRLSGTEVVELAVDPDLRGGGIGRRLLERLVGAGPAWLLTYPGADADGWYDRLGWERLGEFGDEVRLVAYGSHLP